MVRSGVTRAPWKSGRTCQKMKIKMPKTAAMMLMPPTLMKWFMARSTAMVDRAIS